MKKIFIFISIALISLAACKQKSDKKAVLFSGFVVWEKDYTTFTDCNTGKEYWLQDPEGKMAEKMKELGTGITQPVFASFEAGLLPPATTGAAASFDNIMEVKNVTVVQATPPKDACKVNTDKPSFDCMGSTPTWTITNNTDIIFKTNYPKDTLVYFPLIVPTVRDSAGAGKLFYYYVENENFQKIEIIVLQKPCKTENGKMNRFTSKVIFGGITYNGCATLKPTPNETAPTAYTGHTTGRGL